MGPLSGTNTRVVEQASFSPRAASCGCTLLLPTSLPPPRRSGISRRQTHTHTHTHTHARLQMAYTTGSVFGMSHRRSYTNCNDGASVASHGHTSDALRVVRGSIDVQPGIVRTLG